MNQDSDFDDDFEDDFDTLDDDHGDWDENSEEDFDAPPQKKKSSMGLVLGLLIIGGIGGSGYMYKDTVMSYVGPYIGQDTASLAPEVATPEVQQTADLNAMPTNAPMGNDPMGMDMDIDPFAAGTSAPLTDVPEIGFGLPGDPNAMSEQPVPVDTGLDGFEGVETVAVTGNVDGMPPHPGEEGQVTATATGMDTIENIPESIDFAADAVEDEIDAAMSTMPALTDQAEDTLSDTVDVIADEAEEHVEEIVQIDALPSMADDSSSFANSEKIRELEDKIADLQKENDRLSAENKKLSRSSASANTQAKVSVSKPAAKPKAQSKKINWEIRSASKGRAIIAAKGKNDMVSIREGQRVDGLGVIKDIRFLPNQGWQVSTSEGQIIR